MSENCDHEWIPFNELEDECIYCGEVILHKEYFDLKWIRRDSE